MGITNTDKETLDGIYGDGAGTVIKDVAPLAAGAAVVVGSKGRGKGKVERSNDSSNYSNAYTVELPKDAYPNVSRSRHNQISNQQLHEAFESDPSLAARMEVEYPGII